MTTNQLGYKEIVERLLHNTDQRIPPISMSKIAQNFGIKILETSMPKPEVSGFITKEDDGQICIYVNENDSFTRQRFTMAHELAHFYLHCKDKDDADDKKGILDFVRFRNGEYDYESMAEEREANAFAAELLVPFRALKELWDAGYKNKKGADIAFLADKFVVSIEMMEYRLMNFKRDLEKM